MQYGTLLKLSSPSSMVQQLYLKNIKLSLSIWGSIYRWAEYNFFMADILTCHSKRSTGEQKFVGDGLVLKSILLTVDSESAHATPGPWNLNWMQSFLLFSFTLVLFLLCQNVWSKIGLSHVAAAPGQQFLYV